MKLLLAALALISSLAHGQRGGPTAGYRLGDRIVFTPDNTTGALSAIDDYRNTVCVKFDYPRSDGVYERCNITVSLISRQRTARPTDGFFPGVRVVFTPDGSTGTVSSIDSYANSVCVTFDRARSDGAYERCGILLTMIQNTYTESPTERLRVGSRVVFLPDGSKGQLTFIAPNKTTVCMKFDIPRGDGVIERCDIPATYVQENFDTIAPTEGLYPGQRVRFTADGSLGSITSVDHYASTVCVKFDRARSDGVFERCNIQAGLVQIDYETIAPTAGLRVNSRVRFSPDGTTGYIVSIDRAKNLVCMKFDYPRSDGAYERCEIPADLVVLSNR